MKGYNAKHQTNTYLRPYYRKRHHCLTAMRAPCNYIDLTLQAENESLVEFPLQDIQLCWIEEGVKYH